MREGWRGCAPNVLLHEYSSRTLSTCRYFVSPGRSGGCIDVPKTTPHSQNDLPDVLQPSFELASVLRVRESRLPMSPLRFFVVEFFPPNVHSPLETASRCAYSSQRPSEAIRLVTSLANPCMARHPKSFKDVHRPWYDPSQGPEVMGVRCHG